MRAKGDTVMASSKTGRYVIVGSGKFRNTGGAFRDVSLPGGKHAHVMSRRIFESAVEKANEQMKTKEKKRDKLAS